MKVKTTLSHRRNRTLLYGFGEIKFDDNCIADVSDEEYKNLKAIDNSIVEVDQKNDFSNFSLKELKGMAQEFELPLEEWGNLKKAELREYLVSKQNDNVNI